MRGQGGPDPDCEAEQPGPGDAEQSAAIRACAIKGTAKPPPARSGALWNRGDAGPGRLRRAVVTRLIALSR